MAANTDKARKSYSFLQKSLGGSINDSDTSITLNNYTNIPTDTAVDFIIDRIDSNGNRTTALRELCKGVCTGSAITNVVRGLHGTTAQSHSSGAVVEFVASGAAWNDLIDAFIEEHKQDGTHGDVTADSINTDTLQVGSQTFANLLNGWQNATGTWSYSAWDSTYKTGTITVPSDATTYLSNGMRIRISQSTGGTKYGIITETNATSIKVYFGTDYTLNNETISSPFYSIQKAPYGFPTSPAKWTVEVSSTSACSKTSAVNGTWYGDTGLSATSPSIDVPIGIWRTFYNANLSVTQGPVTSTTASISLSTSASSESDVDFTQHIRIDGASGSLRLYSPVHKEKVLSLSSGAKYYLVIKTDTASGPTITIEGAVAKTFIRAVCAYL